LGGQAGGGRELATILLFVVFLREEGRMSKREK
jgi:hypothetical protein